MARFRATMKVVYDFEHPGDHSEATQAAETVMESMLSSDSSDRVVIKKQIRLEPLRKKRCTIYLGEFKPEEVIPYITKDEVKQEYKVGTKSYFVRMNSPRYFIFRDSLKCIACGLEGTRMFLEQNPTDKSPHFNLYAVENGCLVLMTKDHICPKSKGGADEFSNYATACSVCNNLKGNYPLTYAQVYQLRLLLNENRHKSKRKQSEIINKAREEIIVCGLDYNPRCS